MGLFRKFRKKLDYLTSDQIDYIHKAYLVAQQAHRGQKRYSGDPYITHPVAVASILADLKMDQSTLASALLHDVIEDTTLTNQYLKKHFGEEVAELVEGVSKLTQIEFNSRAEAQAENFRKMVLAMSEDIRVIIVKLADRLHNMRTLEPLPPHKRRRIARETLDIFAPVAQRLGMHEISVELEELGFACLYRQRYRAVKEAMRKARGYRKNILEEINYDIRAGLQSHKIPFFEVTTREKHLFSIYRKMRDKGRRFEDILDVYAFRIVVDTRDNCYRALGVVHNLYKPIPERFKDYIALPKSNGYQSIHSTLFGPHGVPVEVQIRTNTMDQFAQKGIAAHWLYKEGTAEPDAKSIKNQQWLSNLVEMQKSTGSSLEFIENVKIDLFPDEVYVFSPKGSIFELPKRATAVDFAYAVHTDIGNACIACKIDHKLAPLSTILSNGQSVEIITSKGARPNPAWLNFVVTGKARSCIRHYLKNQQRSQSIVLGEEMLSKALRVHGKSKNKLTDKIKEVVINEAGLEKWDDLLESIGMGNRMSHVVAERVLALANDNKDSEKYSDDIKPVQIKGTEGIVVNYAPCCHPIPGDPIVSILRSGRGLYIHHQQCSKIAGARHDPNHFMAVVWADDVVGEFDVNIFVSVVNGKGVLAAITKEISDAESSISDLKIGERDEDHYELTITVQVKDRKHLAQIIRGLKKLSCVLKLQRVVS